MEEEGSQQLRDMSRRRASVTKREGERSEMCSEDLRRRRAAKERGEHNMKRVMLVERGECKARACVAVAANAKVNLRSQRRSETLQKRDENRS